MAWKRPKLLFVFGTRPEAIKLCPLIRTLTQSGRYEIRVCVTGQHRQMLDQVLSTFGVIPGYDLDIMAPGQTLFGSTSRMMSGLEEVFKEEEPTLTVVQGDTTSTFCGALASLYAHVPVGHVEAGLRTGDLAQPFPEEANRILTSRLTALHFAPTGSAAEILRRELVAPERIFVTGNTGIDAVLYVSDALRHGQLRVPGRVSVPQNRKLILVTAHRRENFGAPFSCICRAIAQIANRPDVHVVFPAHLNPNVRRPIAEHLAGHPQITILPPLDYVPFVDLLSRAFLVITDSGGIQEECPSLGKPVVVLREKTERFEAVDVGTVRLAGTNAERIVAEVFRLLDSAEEHQCASTVHNPYGDGKACQRIQAALDSYFGRSTAEDLNQPFGYFPPLKKAVAAAASC
ncbi:MAG: UDP-N-acetylglucosamine 2-epimerase (non-hydrolyzing) [Acidobacteriaceae bacterium]|nr:UDP-N-acetylglucosamine 2-epimerase (non-hydrolyzing) [Acidobacteriaceae bacterium]